MQAEDGDADPEPADPGVVGPEDLDDAIFEELWADGDGLEAEGFSSSQSSSRG